MQALYPYTAYSLMTADPKDVTVCKKDKQASKSVIRILGNNCITATALSHIFACVRKQLSNDQHVIYKRPHIMHSVVIAPLKEGTRRVFVSLHKPLLASGAQGVRFTETVMLTFDSTGNRLRGKKGVEKILRLTFPVSSFTTKRISIMQKLQGSDCVPTNFDYIQKVSGKICVYQERASYDLFTLHTQLPNGLYGLPDDAKISMVKQLTKFLYTLRENGIIHRDIKPENILVKELPSNKYEIKLTDFGLSCKQTDVEASLHVAGSPTWASAEKLMSIIGGKRPSAHAKEDVWSVGAIIYLLYNQQLPKHFVHVNSLLNLLELQENVSRNALLHQKQSRSADEETEYNSFLETNNLTGKKPEEVTSFLKQVRESTSNSLKKIKSTIHFTFTRHMPSPTIVTIHDLVSQMLDPNPHTRISSDLAYSASDAIFKSK